MTDLRAAVTAFLGADPVAWPGLPAGVTLKDVADLADLLELDRTDLRCGDAGDPPGARKWVAVETHVYAGGLRLWLADEPASQTSSETVVALEGIHPLDADGDFRTAPDLGAPDASFEAVLGPLYLPDAEQVYPARGLAVRRNPANGLLLGLVGFAPTDAEDYRNRIRPVPEPTRPLSSARMARGDRR